MKVTSRRGFLGAGSAAAAMISNKSAARSAGGPAAALLANKIAVVYGAAGAIGSVVSRAFARQGAHVELAGRTLTKVAAIAKELRAQGASAHAAQVNALERESVERHLAGVVETRGRVDISFNLISVEGIQGDALLNMSTDSFSAPIVGAMRTHYLTATAAARHMRNQHSGVILMLTAQVARKPYPHSGGFGVACAAIEGLSRQLAVELGPDGIRVVTLRSAGSPDAPGVSAAIADHARSAGVSREEFEARIAEKTMLRRMPKVAEIADAALLMASDHASAITAAVTNVTCGEIAD